MFADYTTCVVQDYQLKKRDNTLPLSLINPKPAKLREVCLSICEERFDRKDERTLRSFFGPFYNKEDCLKIIAGYDIDRFRPLVNFLKGDTVTTEDKNVELLAWLINFTPRPYEFGKSYGPCNALQDGPAPIDPGVKGNSDAPPTGPGSGGSNTKRKKILIAAAILLAILTGVFWPWHNKSSAPVPTGACMFWDEDHYRPISCRQHGDTPVVALDSNKLLHFRKVMKPDTITTNAIGTLWYTKYRKNYEFYTSDGYHPIDPSLRLRPVTEYIIRNHVHPEQ